jgi:ATP-binding cassette subfamily F protein 3
MSLVRLDNVHKSFNAAEVLDGVSFQIEQGDKIGLVGRNGTGKSTIFRLITGEYEPDKGRIERMRRARVACLAQLPHFSAHETIFDRVLHSFAGFLAMEKELGFLEDRITNGDERALHEYSVLQEQFTVQGGYEFRSRAKRVLHGLGFTENDFSLPVTALSGGQRTRLMLALVLLEDADLLLLDEPENHLDLAAREWLEDFLKSWERSFVIISHDRTMLNAVTERIIEIERGGIRSHKGNYEAFLADKELVLEQQQRAYERQQEFIAKEETWINRFRYKKTKARQAQSRLKALEKIERIDAPMAGMKSATFNMGEVVRSGQRVLEAFDLSMSYGDLRLYSAVAFYVERGERVGIIGPNGAGKTTLLRQLAGRLPEGRGTVTLGHKVKLGFYDQHHETLNPSNDIMKEVWSADPKLSPEQVRSFLGRFLFRGEDVFKQISALSGGELSRVAIAKLILDGCNLILLDEPTNHLDIPSREALEMALSEFQGSLIVVSHDRTLIDALVDKLVLLERGSATIHLGNYTDYRLALQAGAERYAIKPEATRSAEDVLRIRQASSKSEKADGKVQRKQRKQLKELEERIQEIEELLEQAEGQFAHVDPADYVGLQNLKDNYDGLKADLSAMYEEWERLAEELKG